MHATLRKFTSEWMPALLATMIVITACGEAFAQTSTRSFQMGLWTDPSPDADSDIAVFWGSQSQPAAGRSIWVNGPASSLYSVPNIDWSRIVAVEMDEPYAGMDHILLYPDGSPACQPNSVDLANDIGPIDTMLKQRAMELRALAPRARFWVDFDRIEANWMAHCGRPDVFNRDYIDVVSADWTDDGANNTISTAQPFYSLIAATRPKPDQQLALIPGVYSAPYSQLPHLQGFFDYANNTNQNQTCNLPLGSRSVTGISDGCPIWIVLGWISDGSTGAPSAYVGMLLTGSEKIKKAWEAERALPLAPSLAHLPTPAQMIQPILQLSLQ